MTAVQLVIFDLAGTLVDYGSIAPVRAFLDVFADAGVTVTEAETRPPMGMHKKDHIRRMFQTESVAKKWQSTTGKSWTEADVETLYRLVTPLQLAAAAQYSDLTPGALDCVQALRAHRVKIATATGYFPEAATVVREALKRQGLVADFAIGADEVSAGRPAPWMIFHIMEALNIYPPSAVVKVGDTLVDIEEGLNAGVRSGAVVESSSEMGLSFEQLTALDPDEREERRRQVRERFLAAGAEFVVDTLAELPTLLV